MPDSNRVLLDTNVVLDVLLERTPFVNDAAVIWQGHETGRISAYISAITPVNVFYIARRLKGRTIALEAVNILLTTFPVAAVTQRALESAFALGFDDYEDAVQHACAVEHTLQAIVTRNQDDFSGATLQVFTPAAFVAENAQILS